MNVLEKILNFLSNWFDDIIYEVRIDKCSVNLWWYESHIGEIYNVVSLNKNMYEVVLDGKLYGKYIKKCDCTVLTND